MNADFNCRSICVLRITGKDQIFVTWSILINMVHYTSVTEKISVTVSPVYLDGESSYFLDRFVFAYFIAITNHRRDPVQLLRRYWRIHEQGLAAKEVDAEGVVGKQPLIKPGESYYYNSFCILKSFEGSMEGHYTMSTSTGKTLRIAIPQFHLKVWAN